MFKIGDRVTFTIKTGFALSVIGLDPNAVGEIVDDQHKLNSGGTGYLFKMDGSDRDFGHGAGIVAVHEHMIELLEV